MLQTRGAGSYIQIYLPTCGALIILLHMDDLGISFSGDIKVVQLLIVFHCTYVHLAFPQEPARNPGILFQCFGPYLWSSALVKSNNQTHPIESSIELHSVVEFCNSTAQHHLYIAGCVFLVFVFPRSSNCINHRTLQWDLQQFTSFSCVFFHSQITVIFIGIMIPQCCKTPTNLRLPPIVSMCQGVGGHYHCVWPVFGCNDGYRMI
jgi:hypothetical protein